MTSPSHRFIGKQFLLCVTGSIAAYKSVSLLRRLIHEGADVRVVMTAAATQFITPLTFEVLSRHPVIHSLFDHREEMPHITLPTQSDAILVVPATANILAKSALGLGDDFVGTLLLNATCPVLFAPAMDGDMWRHPAIQAHVQTLRQRDAYVLEPGDGPLASGAFGKGRLPHEEDILTVLDQALDRQDDFARHRVLISAGPTQEDIDPVRFISNRSSGKMGYALARAARERGAQVKLISGPTHLSIPAGVERENVRTAEEMNKALTHWFSWATLLIMSAAVADFRPLRPSSQKLPKQAKDRFQLELEPTVDILHTLAKKRTHQLLIGFAAQTDHVPTMAAQKLLQKGLDLIVGNKVGIPGSGFESDYNAAVLITKNGETTKLDTMSKQALADCILDAVLSLPDPVPSQRPSTEHSS